MEYIFRLRNAIQSGLLELLLLSEYRTGLSGDQLSDAGPYTHKNIVSGMFDDQLRAYAKSAKSFGTKLLIEYGVEVNTNSFP